MKLTLKKVPFNFSLLIINLILIIVVGQFVTAEDNLSDTILEQSTYLYYYESDDQIISPRNSKTYTFAPYPGEKITIAAAGLDETATTNITLYDSDGEVVATASNNTVTRDDEAPANDKPQTPYLTALEHTAESGGLYYFVVENTSAEDGLIRSMLFVGEPFSTDLTLIDKLNPLLPSKVFMVAGDPSRTWENELTGETVDGLRTLVDVQEIERLDRAPDVFTTYSTFSYLPDAQDRLTPKTFFQWFNDDGEEIYLVNIRPLPEDETQANRTILENLDYQTYNSNNFFFFDYLFTVGNGSDPIALDRGAGACAGLADRNGCIAADDNFGRTVAVSTDTSQSSVVASPVVTGASTGEAFDGQATEFSIDSSSDCTPLVGNTSNDTEVTIGDETVCISGDIYSGITGDIIEFIPGNVSGTQGLCQGATGNDFIICSTGSDWIEGGAGNDIILGAEGDDDIFGGIGDDYITGNVGDDSIEGGSGFDTIEGGAGSDIINVGADGGIATGGTGADTLILDSSMGNSTLSGGSDLDGTGDGVQDTFDFNDGVSGSFTIITDGADLLDFTDLSSGVDVTRDTVQGSGFTGEMQGNRAQNIDSTDSADTFDMTTCTSNPCSVTTNNTDYTINSNAGNDTITTASGDDTINAGAGNDSVDSGAGDDTIDGGTGNDTIDGGLGNDSIDGGTGNDSIDGGEGNDTIDGGAGNDSIDGGEGNDTIDGGTEDDTIDGGLGNDSIDGGTGDDTIDGGLGNDSIDGGAGDDTIDGGAGIDRINESTATSDLTVVLTDGAGSIDANGNDTLYNIENVTTGSGDDTFTLSDSDNNVINASGGDDTVNLSTSGTLTVERSSTRVSASGASTGNDTYNNIETLNITGDTSDDTISLTDSGDNTVVGGGGTDTLTATKNSTTNGTVNVTRGNDGTGAVLNVDGTGFGTDQYSDIDEINIVGSLGNEHFAVLDEENNIIDGGSGLDTVTTTQANDTAGTITVTRDSSGSGDNVTVAGTTGFGTDTLNNIDEVRIVAGDGDDTFDILDAFDNVFNGGSGTDTADYTNSSGDITATINTQTQSLVTGAGVGTDTLVSIENLVTGNADDTFSITDDGDNVIDGGGGDNTLTTSMIGTGDSTIVISRTGASVSLTGTGFGSDTYENMDEVGVVSNAGNDTFTVTDDGANVFNAGSNGATGDTIDYSSVATGGVVVDLENETATDNGGTGIGNDTLVGFENIIGTDNDDELTGDSGDNVITGGAGDDTIDGGSGGTDLYDESDSTTDMTITLYSGAGTSSSIGEGNDTLANIDNISTGSGNDTFTLSDSGNNTIDANGGTDEITVEGGAGVITITRSGGGTGTDVSVSDTGSGIGIDSYLDMEQVNVSGDNNDNTFIITDTFANEIDGQGGVDSISYASSSTTTVTITGDSAVVDTGDVGDDTLTNIESITTGSNDDVFDISGNPTIDYILDGGSGYNTFEFNGGISGDFTLDTSSSSFLDFSNFTGSGITIELSDTSQQTVTGSLDITLGTGSLFNTIYGSAQQDDITGTSGDDTIWAGAGDDTLDGGAGDDDLIDDSNNTDDITIAINSSANGTMSSTSGGTDSIANVENINTGSGDDTITINDSSNNTIDTNGGTDVVTVEGGSGTITLTRSGTDVSVSDTGSGIGSDSYLDIEQVNVSGSASNDTFILTDELDNIIDGNGGIDEVDYSSISDNINVTVIAANMTVDTAANTINDTLLDIENVTTGDGDDTFAIEANNTDNTFDAGGHDTTGDTAAYTDLAGTIEATVNSGSIEVTLDSGETDTLTNFENMSYTGAGDDNTFIIDDGKSSVIDAGGETTADTYDASSFIGTTDLTVDLSASDTFTVSGLDGGDDTLIDFENIVTGGGDDIFIIDTDIGGTFFFDAGGSTLGNLFQFSGGGSAVTNITISTDSGSLDTLDFSGFTHASGIDIDLSDNTAQTVGNNLTLTINNTINTIVGTNNADTIAGTSGTDTINAGGGDDTITFSEGDDEIDGGTGDDTIDYSSATTLVDASSAVTITLDTGTMDASVSGSTANQTLTGLEGVIATDNDDTFIINGETAVTVNAGGENSGDLVDFSNLSAGITFDMTTGSSLVDGTVAGDNATLLDFEDVIGSALDDTIIGNNEDNTISGGAGDDTIEGNGGNDTLDGGADTDTVDYSGASSGITVDLENETASNDGDGGNDTVRNFEVISGTDFADSISGSSGADVIYGGAGNDTIEGLAGDDTIIGGDGADLIYGGDGSDAISGSAGNDVIYGGSDNTYGTATDDTGDDIIYGGDDSDTIYGGNDNTGVAIGGDDTGSDTIYAGNDASGNQSGGGADLIYGGNDNSSGGTGNDGNDTIYGSDDSDTIYGGNENNSNTSSGDDGKDTIDANDGNDTVYGGNNNDGGGTGNDDTTDMDATDGTASDVIEGGDGSDVLFGGNNNQNGGTGNDGGDQITDAANGTTDDSDAIIGDNNNQTGGTGSTGADLIDVNEGDTAGGNEDDVAGDNLVDTPSGDPSTDQIDSDADDTVVAGDD